MSHLPKRCMPVSYRLENFFRKFPVINFPSDRIILEPGNTASYLFFIKSGVVRQYSLSKTGDVFLVNFLFAGHIFPLSSAFGNHTNQFFYDSFQSVKLYKIPILDFVGFIKTHPDALFHFSSRILDVVSGLNSRMQILSTGLSPHRLMLFLLYMSKASGKRINGKVIIDLPLTHREIANWIGTTRETVSWQMLNLKKLGLINYSRQFITILDLSRLQEATNFA